MDKIIQFIISIIQSQLFITIISGVVVFVLSQYFLELIIFPRKKLLGACAQLSQVMLVNQRKFHNSSLNDLERDEIRNASTNLLSNVWIVYRTRKKREKYLRIAKLINFIISQNNNSTTNYSEVISSLKEIETINKGIITTYQW
jgi:hypothetical protein